MNNQADDQSEQLFVQVRGINREDCVRSARQIAFQFFGTHENVHQHIVGADALLENRTNEKPFVMNLVYIQGGRGFEL